MATITKTIGTDSKDYSTVTLWEADLDNTGEYSSTDDAVGEAYNDSVFNEAVTFNGGNTSGLSSVKLSVAAGERHTGTAGTGVRNIRSPATAETFKTAMTTIPITIEWWEIQAGGSGSQFGINLDSFAGTEVTVAQNNIVWNVVSATTSMAGITSAEGSGSAATIQNNIVYNCICASSGAEDGHGINSSGDSVLNNTVYLILNNNGTGDAIGINDTTAAASRDVRNNVVATPGGTSSGTKACFGTFTGTGTYDYNAATDTSAPGANSVQSITASAEFVSLTIASEDLHLKATSTLRNLGVNLTGVTTDIETDIDGTTRHATAPWDIGADDRVGYTGTIVQVLPSLTQAGSGVDYHYSYDVGEIDEETALLIATVTRLRAEITELNVHNCTVEDNDDILADITNARCGCIVVGRGWRSIQDHASGNVSALQYAQSIFCWIRVPEVPRDRRRNQLVDINLSRKTLNLFVARVNSVVDWNLQLINDASALLADNGDEQQGFQHPFELIATDPNIRHLDNDFFSSTSAGSDHIFGLGRSLNYDNAWRKRVRLPGLNQ